ncbi:hypothetical protein GINT2_001047 [Glugoides intestinalis]
MKSLSSLNGFYSCIKPTSSEVIAGIDEAGRGPVIGPMVYGLYVAPCDEITHYKDSKLLSKEARERFFTGMKEYAYYKIDPVYITSIMESGEKNLNEISREAVVYLLKELVKKCPNTKHVFIDGLGNNNEYKRILETQFTLNFTIENKADSKYQVVSGASIVAKVIRDQSVNKLNCGSGYPSDPITKEWLKRNHNATIGFPEFVRHSWLTVKTLFPSKKARKLQNSLKGFFVGPN